MMDFRQNLIMAFRIAIYVDVIDFRKAQQKKRNKVH